jgi:hypothetical protein
VVLQPAVRGGEIHRNYLATKLVVIHELNTAITAFRVKHGLLERLMTACPMNPTHRSA